MIRKVKSRSKSKSKTRTNTKTKTRTQTKVARPAKKEGSPWDWVFAPRQPGEKRYWLAKSEPGVFSFDDLMARPDRTTFWDGVRNFTARNFMRHGMKLGDQVFFYHSNAEPSAIVGICEVVREGYPDHTALDRNDPHFDEGSDPNDPTWYMVDIRAVQPLARPVSLPELRAQKALAGMALLRIGRLSVTPVRAAEWDAIMKMAK